METQYFTDTIGSAEPGKGLGDVECLVIETPHPGWKYTGHTLYTAVTKFARQLEPKIEKNESRSAYVATIAPASGLDYVKQLFIERFPSLNFGWFSPVLRSVPALLVTIEEDHYYQVAPLPANFDLDRKTIEITLFSGGPVRSNNNRFADVFAPGDQDQLDTHRFDVVGAAVSCKSDLSAYGSTIAEETLKNKFARGRQANISTEEEIINTPVDTLPASATDWLKGWVHRVLPIDWLAPTMKTIEAKTVIKTRTIYAIAPFSHGESPDPSMHPDLLWLLMEPLTDSQIKHYIDAYRALA